MVDRSGSTEVSSYMIHPTLKPRLDKWLRDNGFAVHRLSPDMEHKHGQPTYVVYPMEAGVGNAGD